MERKDCLVAHILRNLISTGPSTSFFLFTETTNCTQIERFLFCIFMLDMVYINYIKQVQLLFDFNGWDKKGIRGQGIRFRLHSTPKNVFYILPLASSVTAYCYSLSK